MERSLFEDRGIERTPAGFLAVRDHAVLDSEHTSVSFSNGENLVRERNHWTPPAEERGHYHLVARLYRIRTRGQGRVQIASYFGTVEDAEKKVWIQVGFLTRWPGAEGRVYFQTGLSVEVAASVRAWRRGMVG